MIRPLVRFPLSIAVLILTAACGRAVRTAPAPHPLPESQPAVSAGALPQPEAPTAAPDTTAPIATPDDSVSRQEVTREAVRVFGDSLAPTAIVADAGITGEDITWDIDVRSYETRERVGYWINIFAVDAKSRIEDRLSRGTRYEPMIRAKLRAAGLPEDMYYLALIESGFNPHAYSRSAAVGIWQFMTATAKGAGLRVDWWVDERRDPIRSTDAAMKFLNYLNDQFGSLYLAAAAYNGGPGRIARNLRRHEDELGDISGDDAFFALADVANLPRETEDYVPKLIAAALVGKNPSKYGLTVAPRDTFAYDSVRVGPTVPLSAVATAAGATIPEIVELNSHILRGVTPPKESSWVRLPVGRAAAFDSTFRMLDTAARSPWKRVKPRKGQTLAAVARAHDLSEKHLAWYNPKIRKYRSGRLFVDQTILVPKRLTVAAAQDVPDPSIERYGSAPKIHVVKRGQTLSHIARRYKTTVARLMRLNGLRKATIFPGQTLRVSGNPPRRAAARPPRSGTGTKSSPARSSGSGKPAASKAPKSAPSPARGSPAVTKSPAGR